MRLWSIHPSYLDRQGLLAVWREGLLALKVLEGKTKGYKNHPQLDRFKNTKDPIQHIKNYLYYIWKEADNRGYKFNHKKINLEFENWYLRYENITITKGQLKYEFNHLQRKLHARNYKKYRNNNIKIRTKHFYQAHPIFTVIAGGLEKWEKLKKN